MAWAAAHQCVLIACVALAPAIGNIPEEGAAGLMAALCLFFLFSEGVRRAAWRRQVYGGEREARGGSAAYGALLVSLPALLVAWGAWAAYGYMSLWGGAQMTIGVIYILAAITAGEAVVGRIREWRPWMFNALCLVLHPMFLFGPLFRPDQGVAPTLYKLSLLNPVVPAIEAARAGLFGAPMPAGGAWWGWWAAFMVIVLWCGGTVRLPQGRERG